MKNMKKNQVRKNGSLTNGFFRTLPIIAVLAASGFIQPAFAVDRTWFGGNGDWELDTFQAGSLQEGRMDVIQLTIDGRKK